MYLLNETTGFSGSCKLISDDWTLIVVDVTPLEASGVVIESDILDFDAILLSLVSGVSGVLDFAKEYSEF